MIKFDRLWKTMEKRNISTYYLREKSGIDSKTALKIMKILKQRRLISYVKRLTAI